VIQLATVERKLIEGTFMREAELVIPTSIPAGLIHSSAVFSPCRKYRYTVLQNL
jgi:hypothetical protein